MAATGSRFFFEAVACLVIAQYHSPAANAVQNPCCSAFFGAQAVWCVARVTGLIGIVGSSLLDAADICGDPLAILLPR